MADGSGKRPHTSDVHPASCPSSNVSKNLQQGADKSMSSQQESDSATSAKRQRAGVTFDDLPADDKPDKETSETKEVDLSMILPPHVWLIIFSHLDKHDRLVLSATCRTLHDLCQSSSVLWRSADIHVGCGQTRGKAALSIAEKLFLCAHSHHLKKVIIHINRLPTQMLNEDSHRQLCEAARSWPLTHLEIKVTKDVSYYELSEPQNNLLYNCFTSPKAEQLVFLIISALDGSPVDSKSCIVEALKSSSFSSSLTHLYLAVWGQYQKNAADLCTAVARFQNLQCLMIPFLSLSNTFLNNLPESLTEVHFIVYCCGSPEAVTNWPQALASRPQLTVGLIFLTWPSSVIFSRIPPPVVPVSSVRLNPSYTSHTVEFLDLLTQYSLTLKVLQLKFLSITGRQLVDLVSGCPKLDRLYFQGFISSYDAIALARVRQWTVLDVDATFFDFITCRDRDHRLKTLCEKVSSILGRDWKPREWKKYVNFAWNHHTKPLESCFF